MLVAVDIEEAIVLWSLPHPNPMKMRLQQLRSSFPKNFLQLELQGRTVLSIQTWRSSWEISHRTPWRIWDLGRIYCKNSWTIWLGCVILHHLKQLLKKDQPTCTYYVYLLARSERRQGDQPSSTLLLALLLVWKMEKKVAWQRTSNLWQEVNPSLFRRVWPKTNIWTSWNRNHGIQQWTDCIQIKTALNRNSRILVMSKRHANETSPYTLNRWNRYQSPESPPQSDFAHHIATISPAVASIGFHHSTPLPTSGFAGDWRKGFVEKFHEKDWKRLDVCSYGVVLMFLLQHSAPHYFREPIVHRFESRCHTIARQFVTFVYPNPSLDIFIMGGKWGHW